MSDTHTPAQPVAYPCQIVEADFSGNTVTLQMTNTDYKVSAAPHWLCTADPQPVIAPSLPIVREAVAQAIYEQWVYLASFKPWQAGGNSQMQDKARAIANAAFESTPQPVIAPEWVMLTEDEIQTIMFAAGTGWTHVDVPTVRALITAFIAKQNGIL